MLFALANCQCVRAVAVAVALSAVGSVCLPLSTGWTASYGYGVLASSVCGSDCLAMALTDDLAVSAWLSFFVLSGASAPRSSCPGRAPLPLGFKEVDQAHPATAPTGHETKPRLCMRPRR